MLALQRSAGNTAVARRLLQRAWLPDGRWDQPISHRTWYRRRSAQGWEYHYEENGPQAHPLLALAPEAFSTVGFQGLDEVFPAQLRPRLATAADVQFDVPHGGSVAIEQAGNAQIWAAPDTAVTRVEWDVIPPREQDVVFQSTGVRMPFAQDVFTQYGYGRYTFTCRVWFDGTPAAIPLALSINVLGPGNPNAVQQQRPQVGQKIGSHWTSTAFDHVFQRFGLREAGNDAQLGEGFYTTTDDGLGILVGLSVVQEIRAGEIREWEVWTTQQLTTVDKTDEMEWKQLPYRAHAETVAYVRDYDAIINAAEPEIKLNTRAFGKVALVPGRILNVGQNQQLIQQIQQKRKGKAVVV